MKIKLGRSWAPEPKADKVESLAVRELRILLEKIFRNRKRELRTKSC